MPGGDYLRIASIYGLKATDVDLPTVSALVVPSSATKAICVQRIVFTPATFTDMTLTFSDSLTGNIIGSIVVSSGSAVNGVLPLDWGPVGTKLSVGASLLIGGNASAGRLHIESYQKRS